MIGAKLLSGVALVTWAIPAVAQSTAPATATPSAGQEQATQDNGAIADIVVTAQKRSENLQHTPLAVTALTANTIKALGISTAGDLTAVAPSLSVTTSAGSASNLQLYIRGIGASDPVLTSDSPVGLYVDGIIIGRGAGSAFDILDLERIEVLRGPQGTLYGRNTIGGAVNLITAKPQQNFGVEQQFSYGNYNFLQSKTTVDTGDIAGTGLKARLTYFHKQRDGYVDDVTQRDNRDPGAYNVNAFRAAVRYESGPFTLDYAFDYSKKQADVGAFQLTAVRPDVLAYLSASPQLGGTAPEVSTDRLDPVRLNSGLVTDKVMGHTITGELKLGDITIRSLTGFRQFDNHDDGVNVGGINGVVGFTVSPAVLAPPYPFIPLGVTPLDLFRGFSYRHQSQFSQEINVLGSVGKFDFVVGGYYFNEHSSEHNDQNFLLVLPSPVPITLTPTVTLNSFGVPLTSMLYYDHYSRSKAGFAQGTYHITDTLKITGGIRYTDDDKHLVQTQPLVRDVKASFGKFNYSVNINWQASPDVLVYASTSTGYKSGGFNARSVNSAFKPETLTSYEAGVKSDLLDHHVRLNLTGFYMMHHDVQLQQFQAGSGGATSVTVNAGKARYWGVEGELTVKPVNAVTLGGNVGYTNRKYLQFLILDPTTNTVVDVKNSAHFLIGATTTVSAYAQWDIADLPIGKLSLRGDYDYRGRIYFNPTTVGTPFNDAISAGPRSLVNARLSLTNIKLNGADAEIALWGRNVFNVKYREHGIDFGSLGYAGNVYGEPATYGIDLRLKL